MKKSFIITFLVLFYNASLLAQDSLAIRVDSISEYQQNVQSPKYKTFFNLGLWNTISTNGYKTKYYTNNISFNLVYGRSENVSGFAFSGLYNQITKAKGVVISPFSNVENISGVQIGGMQMGDCLNGVQIGGIHVARDIKGIQIGGLNNVIWNMQGTQIGIINLAYKNIRGAQIGFFNNSEKIKGVQIAMGNEADTLVGVQIGGFNYAKVMKGLQIGIINISDNNKYPIGLVNIVKSGGDMNLALTFDDMQNMVVSFRSGGQSLYGIVGFGYNIYSPHTHFVLEGGLGAHIQLSDKFRIDTEIIAGILTKIRTSIRVGEQSKEEEEREKEILRNYDHKTLYRFVYRVLPAYNINSNINIFAGPTLNFLQTSKLDNLKLFSSHSLWKDYSPNSFKQLYIGWMIGVGYRF